MCVKTSDEIRRYWLTRISQEHGGPTKLNRLLGRKDRDATINQLINASPDSKTGKPRSVGAEFARNIEKALGLERGLMDTDPDLAPWPFESISREEFLKLETWQRQGIERKIEEFIRATAQSFEVEKEQPPRKSANGG